MTRAPSRTAAHPVEASASTLWWTVMRATVLGLAAATVVGVVLTATDDARVVVRGVAIALWVIGGAAIVSRIRDRPMGSASALAVTTISALGAIAHLAAVRAADSPERGWSSPAGVLGVFAIAAVISVAFAYLASQPDGRLRSGGRRWLVATMVVASAAVAALAVEWADATVGVLTAWAVVVVLGGCALAASTVRRSTPMARRRLLWFLLGLAAVGETVLVLAAVRLASGWPRQVDLGVWCVVVVAELVAAATLLHPASSNVALDRPTAAMIAIVVTTLAVGVVYLGIVVGLLGDSTAHDRSVLLLSLGAAVAAVAIAGPARRWSSQITGRLALGESPGSAAALRAFPSRMTRAVPMDELLQQLVELTRDAYGLRSAEMWRMDGGQLEVAASVPHVTRGAVPVADAERPALSRSGVAGGSFVDLWLPGLAEGRRSSDLRVTPVLHAGELLGVFVLETEAGASGLRPADETIVVELARQVGLALHNVELDTALQESLDEVRAANEQLRTSRARIVAAGDAERRKLERNLHDGAQQHLVALAVNLRLVRDIVAEDAGPGTETATEMLTMLADSVKEAIEELRALAHGIYPPLLVDSGLGEALRAAATRSPLRVDVECAGVGRHSAESEAAVYFCCLEALQNTAKHAEGAHVHVTVTESAERLSFAVTDDGPGFDPASVVDGHGHTNMSDRLGAIGGEVLWRSAPGEGTSISGWVPAAPTSR